MKLEEALDEAIAHFEDRWLPSDDKDPFWWHVLLRCADLEWQRREMRKEGVVHLDQYTSYIKTNITLPTPEREEPHKEQTPRSRDSSKGKRNEIQKSRLANIHRP